MRTPSQDPFQTATSSSCCQARHRDGARAQQCPQTSSSEKRLLQSGAAPSKPSPAYYTRAKLTLCSLSCQGRLLPSVRLKQLINKFTSFDWKHVVCLNQYNTHSHLHLLSWCVCSFSLFNTIKQTWLHTQLHGGSQLHLQCCRSRRTCG